MSWKKNAFSFFVWLVYIVLAGTSVIATSAVLVDNMGYLPQYGILLAGVIALVEGLLVLLVHKLVTASAEKEQESHSKIVPLICEAIVILAFLVVGVLVRIEGLRNITNIDESMIYFEFAKVANGQSIPQIVHGAVYFYLQLLHMLFVFLGNKIAMAFWMQVILQLLAVLVLYRAVRRLIGKLPSVIMFVLLMCSTWMVQEVLYLSPNIILLLCFAIVLWIISLGAKASKIHFSAWLVIGALVATVSYIDISGLTLLLPMVGALFTFDVLKREGIRRSFSALGMSVLGFVLVFSGIIIIDAVASGKNILNVFLAWFQVYVPGYFQLGYALDGMNFYLLIENVVVFALLLVGVFTFWCRKETEKISLWICEIILVLLAQCFQLTTVEADGKVFLYVFIAILTSIGIAEMFVVNKAEVIEEDAVIDTTEEMEVVDMEQPDAETQLLDEEKVQSDEETQSLEVEQIEKVQPVEVQPVEEEPPVIEYIPNPLPLPKKHEKKVLKYAVDSKEEDDFDFKIEDDDDFDIL